MNKKTQEVLFGSGKGDYRTPVSLFHQLDKEFNFTMDVAADKENTLCRDFLSEKKSAFTHVWSIQNFCNPPYGRGIIAWVNEATVQKERHGSGTVMLLPARTDTKWFHKAMESVNEIRFLKGRLTFQGEEHGAPFPSVLLIWYNSAHVGSGVEPDPHKWQTFLNII